MTSEEVYYERGINLLHGFLTEHYVDDAEFIVRDAAGPEAPARAGRADELSPPRPCSRPTKCSGG